MVELANFERSDSSNSSSQLAFEREKWVAECEFRRRELDLKAKEQDRLFAELQFKEEEARRSRWSSPLVLAIIAASLAALGNAAVSWMNGKEQRGLEETRASSTQRAQEENNKSQLALETFKAESGRILEVIRTNDPNKAAVNLKFLLDSGLITNEKMASFLQAYLDKRPSGEGPVLPLIPYLVPPIPSDTPLKSEEVFTFHPLKQTGAPR